MGTKNSPFNDQDYKGVPFHRNLNSILRRDQKNSCERRTYESVDEKSLYILGYVPKNGGKRINLDYKVLISKGS